MAAKKSNIVKKMRKHKVGKGETAASIAKKHKVATHAVHENVHNKKVLKKAKADEELPAGTVLLIPPTSADVKKFIAEEQKKGNSFTENGLRSELGINGRNKY